jgi:TIR domain
MAEPKLEGQIFISYRRDDSSSAAGRIYDRLDSYFPSNHIFMDVDNLDLGVDFVAAIEKSVGSCDVLIAVMGRQWLTSSDEEGKRRLNNPEDFVRIEIATALKRGIRVIPVLVDGASLPRSGDLPHDLKSLVRRNALEISHTRFKSDCARLIATLERILEGSRAGRLEAEQLEKQPLEAEQRRKEHPAIELTEEPVEAEQLEKERLEAQRHENERTDAEQRKNKGLFQKHMRTKLLLTLAGAVAIGFLFAPTRPSPSKISDEEIRAKNEEALQRLDLSATHSVSTPATGQAESASTPTPPPKLSDEEIRAKNEEALQRLDLSATHSVSTPTTGQAESASTPPPPKISDEEIRAKNRRALRRLDLSENRSVSTPTTPAQSVPAMTRASPKPPSAAKDVEFHKAIVGKWRTRRLSRGFFIDQIGTYSPNGQVKWKGNATFNGLKYPYNMIGTWRVKDGRFSYRVETSDIPNFVPDGHTGYVEIVRVTAEEWAYFDPLDEGNYVDLRVK